MRNLMVKLKIAYGLIVVYLMLSCFGVSAQVDRSGEDDAIRLKSTLVQVPVVVSWPGGRYVADLQQKDFVVYEDGIKQEIEFFGSVEEPFSVALVLDSSGSTAAQLEFIKSAALTFVDYLRPQDRVIVIEFNDSVAVRCELTSDRNLIRQALMSIRSGEFTQVYEAVYTAVWERLHDLEGRKAVILFSDGIDTASSEIVEEDTLDAVLDSEDIIVYPIRYNTRPSVEQKLRRRVSDSMRGSGLATVEVEWESKRRELDKAYRSADEYLEKLAEMSGGIVERADELVDLKGAFARIAEELRHQYLIGYYPADDSRVREDRRIKVEVKRGGVKVRARPSYRVNK